MIGICLGEKGSITRILGPVFDNFITYASVNKETQAVPDQLSVAELTEIYHHHQLNSHSQLYGLIGDPIVQSPSYRTHNAFFRRINLDAIYVRMQISPDELDSFFPMAKAAGFRGISVTIPLKEKILNYLDRIDPDALKMGAVNTISIQNNGTLFGTNTDAAAALDCIEKKRSVAGQTMIILGAGGAAKAIAYEAKKRGAHLIILNRSLSRAEHLAQSLGAVGGVLADMEKWEKKGYQMLINTTPEPEPILLHYLLKNVIVMDISVKHRDSSFLKAARDKNCEVIEGYEMFLRQARGQFALWLNENPVVINEALVTEEIY